MRTTLAAASAGLILAAVSDPAASAQPVAPPEVAPSGVVFTDNAAIVDPHPMSIESWSRTADDNAVAVNFTSGTDTCYGVHATVEETPATVTVDLRGGMLPEAIDRACIMLALFGTLDVPLHAPLGDRQVLDKYT
jgi:hypothetical protein